MHSAADIASTHELSGTTLKLNNRNKTWETNKKRPRSFRTRSYTVW